MTSADDNCETERLPDLICRKTGQRIPPEHPECCVPDGTCKYRSECMIYAMEQMARKKSRTPQP